MKLRYLLAVAFAMAVLTAWSPEARADGWEAFDREEVVGGRRTQNGNAVGSGNDDTVHRGLGINVKFGALGILKEETALLGDVRA